MEETQGTTLEEVVNMAMAKALQADVLQELIDQKAQKLVEEALDRAFYLGDVERAMSDKIELMLIPAIERYDLARCNVKLEALLDELVAESAIGERRDILRRFRLLMSNDDMPDGVTVTQIFDRWQRWAAENFDCTDRHITDGSYDEFEAYIDIEERGSYSGYFRYMNIYLKVEQDENNNADRLNRTIKLSRWHGDETWTIDVRGQLNVSGLRDMPDFDVWVYKLAQVRMPVTLDAGPHDVDYIQPTDEPEYELR